MVIAILTICFNLIYTRKRFIGGKTSAVKTLHASPNLQAPNCLQILSLFRMFLYLKVSLIFTNIEQVIINCFFNT